MLEVGCWHSDIHHSIVDENIRVVSVYHDAGANPFLFEVLRQKVNQPLILGVISVVQRDEGSPCMTTQAMGDEDTVAVSLVGFGCVKHILLDISAFRMTVDGRQVQKSSVDIDRRSRRRSRHELLTRHLDGCIRTFLGLESDGGDEVLLSSMTTRSGH